jgi:MFS family permease
VRSDGNRLAAAARHWLIGPPHVDRLTITHCVHAAAETFFTVSMAGSIFFSVSPDAARPRVLLFLVLTLGPFLVMAPLVGPFVDRIRGGLPTTMVATFAVRTLLALLLAQNLRTLWLFPLAFGVLVVAKTYTVSRNALVPTLVDNEQDLVAANARLSRSATFASAVAASIAVWVFAATSGVWTLRVAAVLYVVGAICAWRVRSVTEPLEPVGVDAFVELVQPDVSGAVWDMIALRAAIGFALFQFGFSLRAEGAAAWVLGAVIFANGFGGFTGTVVSPWLRKVVSERGMFTLALVGSATMAAICGIVFTGVTLVATVFVLGLAVSIGRRALDATIQRDAPRARRGQVYASIETWLELAWVGAACLAVALRVETWIGVLSLAGFLVTVLVIHLRRRRGLEILRPVVAAPLPERLLLRADTLADHRFYDEAIAVALTALQEVDPEQPPPMSAEERRQLAAAEADVQREAARALIQQVRELVTAALRPD